MKDLYKFTSKNFIIIFLGIIILIVSGIVIVWALRGNVSESNRVLGDAQIAVYQKGEKMLLDSEAPYFKDLQLACEKMLTPSIPRDPSPDGYLLLSRNYLTLEEMLNNMLTIEVSYKIPPTVSIIVGTGPTIITEQKIPLSGFLISLAGKRTPETIKFVNKEYSYTPIFIFSNQKKRVATTKTTKKIKNILELFKIKAN